MDLSYYPFDVGPYKDQHNDSITMGPINSMNEGLIMLILKGLFLDRDGVANGDI